MLLSAGVRGDGRSHASSVKSFSGVILQNRAHVGPFDEARVACGFGPATPGFDRRVHWLKWYVIVLILKELRDEKD